MSAWSPDPNSLDQLIKIFKGTISPNTEIRQSATNALTKATSTPDFDNYLLHIFLESTTIDESTRASAGLFLKNDLLKFWKNKPSELQIHLLTTIPHGLLSPSKFVRQITATIVTSLFRLLGPEKWPNIIPNILELSTGAAGPEGQDGSMDALTMICEDSARLLEHRVNGEEPMSYIIPRLIELFSSPVEKIRVKALKCLVSCINIGSMTVLINIDALLVSLFKLCEIDLNLEAKREISAVFVGILEQWPEKLYTNWQGIVSWCTHNVELGEEDVSLQACEFLLTMTTKELPTELIQPYLKGIVPVLLNKMVYEEMDVILMENEDARDDGSEDKDEDIKPQMVKIKEGHKANKKEISNVDEDASSEEEDEDDEFASNYTWNLRKCAAATIDMLASSYPTDLLEISFPIIKVNMIADQWPIREAAILTLGAISEGCLEHASHQLPELVPFLVERLKDTEPRVRQITCWALGRYSSWVCSEAYTGGSFANYFAPTFTAIMDCALDPKKIVKESACSSLADFIDSAEAELIAQYIAPLLEHFQIFFKTYRRKNLIILYDTVQTFAEKVGDQLKYKLEWIDLLLPPLISKWQELSDDDKDLWPLLECMSSVAACLGESFANYAVPVYDRATRILKNCIEQDKLSTHDPNFVPPEKDFIVTSLDLIDGLVQGLTSHSGDLIKQSDASSSISMMELLLVCCDDPADDVRQSAYALLGDLAIYLFEPIVLPFLHTVVMSIANEITNRTVDSVAACNNAIWSLGEISIRVNGDLFSQYVDNFMTILIPLLHDINMDRTLLENTAITVGRFGIHNSTVLSKYVKDILGTWSELMNYLEDNDEKETAFKGMCNVIMNDPSVVDPNGLGLKMFVGCVANYAEPGDELAGVFGLLLNGFKNGLGNNWSLLVNELGVEEVLKLKYNI